MTTSDRPDDGVLVTQTDIDIGRDVYRRFSTGRLNDHGGEYEGEECAIAAATLTRSRLTSPAQVASAPDRAGVDVDQLRGKIAETFWNASADQFNQWDTLGHDEKDAMLRGADAVLCFPTILAALSATPSREGEGERRAIARCIEIVREQQQDFASEDYATGQPMSSFNERFACGQCAEAIEREFAIGTNEQHCLLGKPTPGEQYRAAFATKPEN